MMTVKVDKECGCFRKSGLEPVAQFTDRDAAMIHAQEMAREMNETFCKKHEFRVYETSDELRIAVDDREAPRSGCCGGGHCG